MFPDAGVLDKGFPARRYHMRDRHNDRFPPGGLLGLFQFSGHKVIILDDPPVRGNGDKKKVRRIKGRLELKAPGGRGVKQDHVIVQGTGIGRETA
jgi:hypothetical protein